MKFFQETTPDGGPKTKSGPGNNKYTYSPTNTPYKPKEQSPETLPDPGNGNPEKKKESEQPFFPVQVTVDSTVEENDSTHVFYRAYLTQVYQYGPEKIEEMIATEQYKWLTISKKEVKAGESKSIPLQVHPKRYLRYVLGDEKFDSGDYSHLEDFLLKFGPRFPYAELNQVLRNLSELKYFDFKELMDDWEENQFEGTTTVNASVEGVRTYAEARKGDHFQNPSSDHFQEGWFTIADDYSVGYAYQDKGANMRVTPSTEAEQRPPIRLPKGTEVIVEKFNPTTGWYFVTLEHKGVRYQGYVSEALITREYQISNLDIVRAKQGDNLISIIREHPYYKEAVKDMEDHDEGMRDLIAAIAGLNFKADFGSIKSDGNAFSLTADKNIYLPPLDFIGKMVNPSFRTLYEDEMGVDNNGFTWENLSNFRNLSITDLINSYWPKGHGVTISADLNLGLGVFVAGTNCYYSIVNEGDALLIKYIHGLRGGVGVGVGGGFHFGGKKGKNALAGVQAGADAEATVGLYGYLEQRVPHDDGGILKVLSMLPPPFNLVGYAADTLFYFSERNLGFADHYTKYITESKGSFNVVARGDAEAGIGMRLAKGKEQGKEVYTRNDRGYKDKKLEKQPSINKFLNKLGQFFLNSKLHLGAGISFSVGIDSEMGDHGHIDGKTSYFVEFGLNTQLGILIIPQLNMGGIAGIKWIYEHNSDGEEEYTGVELIFGGGDLDAYNGIASETGLFIPKDEWESLWSGSFFGAEREDGLSMLSALTADKKAEFQEKRRDKNARKEDPNLQKNLNSDMVKWFYETFIKGIETKNRLNAPLAIPSFVRNRNKMRFMKPLLQNNKTNSKTGKQYHRDWSPELQGYIDYGMDLSKLPEWHELFTKKEYFPLRELIFKVYKDLQKEFKGDFTLNSLPFKVWDLLILWAGELSGNSGEAYESTLNLIKLFIEIGVIKDVKGRIEIGVGITAGFKAGLGAKIQADIDARGAYVIETGLTQSLKGYVEKELEAVKTQGASERLKEWRVFLMGGEEGFSLGGLVQNIFNNWFANDEE